MIRSSSLRRIAQSPTMQAVAPPFPSICRRLSSQALAPRRSLASASVYVSCSSSPMSSSLFSTGVVDSRLAALWSTHRFCTNMPGSSATTDRSGRPIKGVLKNKRPSSEHQSQSHNHHIHNHHQRHHHNDDGDQTSVHNHLVKQRRDEASAIHITKLGAVANALFAVSKGATGYAVGSTALVADAINSLSDLLCDAVVYFSVREARKAATPELPWGRGKLEPLGSLVVSGLLLGTGIGIGYSALLVSIQSFLMSMPHEQFEYVKDILHTLSMDGFITSNIPHGGVNSSTSVSIATGVALGVSSVSVVVKEMLYRYTLIAGETANSAAVIANAWQHRSDAAISAGVFLGLTSAAMGYPWMDPLMGVVVSVVVVKQAFITGRDSLRDLSDSPTSEEETRRLRDTCMQVPGILSVDSLLARRSGPFLFVECTVGVKGMISASAAHRIAELVRMALLQQHAGRVANAVVHVTPLGSAGMGDAHPIAARDQDHIASEVTRAVLSLPDVISVSEIQVYYKDDGRIAVKVDVTMNPDLTIRAAHGRALTARKAIESVFPHIASVDVDLELEEEAINAPPLSPEVTETTPIKAAIKQ